MSVSSVGLNQAASISSWRSSIHQARQDFDQLFQALQGGNLSAAQQAYSAFQQVQAGLTSSGTQAGGTTTTGTATSAVASDWSTLGQALQSGSLSSAQDALAKLVQDAQSTWQAQHQQEMLNARSVNALMQGGQGTSATSGATSASSATGSVQNDLTALSQALQSGDTTSAQNLLAQLEQDLQASGQNNGGHHHHHHGGFSVPTGTAAYSSTAATPAASALTSGTTGTGTSTAA